MPDSDPTPEDYKDKYLRAIAELDNLTKRTKKDIAQARDEGEVKVAQAFLPLVDDFKRMLAHLAGAGDTIPRKDLEEGLGLLHARFDQTLRWIEVEGFQVEGEKFAAELMEAVAQVPSRKLPPGTVVDELEQGFMRRGKLLRPARVAVSIEGGGDEPDPA